MYRKHNLLSIGEISKFTGASIKSLRYYERINILKPAYIDEKTRYRYYSFDQTYLIDIIKICIELGIPLSELAQFIDQQDNLDVAGLFVYGKRIAYDKLRRIEESLDFIDDFQEKINDDKKYLMNNKIYRRAFNEKYLYVFDYDATFDEVDSFEQNLKFSTLVYETVFEYGEKILDYGFLIVYNGQEMKRYFCVEYENWTDKENMMIIPAGNYYCLKKDFSMIEDVFDWFKGAVDKEKSFIAIETELFTSKHKIGQPINELKVLVL